MTLLISKAGQRKQSRGHTAAGMHLATRMDARVCAACAMDPQGPSVCQKHCVQAFLDLPLNCYLPLDRGILELEALVGSAVVCHRRFVCALLLGLPCIAVSAVGMLERSPLLALHIAVFENPAVCYERSALTITARNGAQCQPTALTKVPAVIARNPLAHTVPSSRA